MTAEGVPTIDRSRRVLLLMHEGVALGAGLAVARTVPLLREWGWTFTAVVPGDGEMHDILHEAGVRTIRVPRAIAFSVAGVKAHVGRDVARLPALISQVRGAYRAARPDVVHCNTLLALPALAFLGARRAPAVCHVHEIPPPGHKARAAFSAAGRLCEVIVPVSEAVAARCAGGRACVRRVYNGVPAEYVRPAPRFARTASGPLRIGVVGQLSRRKGSDLLVPIAVALRALGVSAEIEHVGGEGDVPAATIRAAAQAHKVEVVLRGRSDVRAALEAWDVFLMPSREDPYPLVVLEAMASGIPVVAARVGGIPEQVDHGVSGLLVDCADVGGFAEALAVYREDELRLRDGAAAWRRASQAFGIENQARGLADAYLYAMDAAARRRKHVTEWRRPGRRSDG